MNNPEELNHPTKICPNCQFEILESNHFCNNCGHQQNFEDQEKGGLKWLDLKQIALFFAVQVLLCLTPSLIDFKSIAANLYLDVIMAITTLLFFGYSWTENKHLLKWKGFSIWKLLIFIIVTILASVIVQYVVRHLNLIVWNKEYNYYDTFRYHPYGKYLMILSIAIFPALFEELAFRGYLMQKLINVFDDKQAVYISSFIFFIMHFSLISVFWLFPFAIILGFVRIRENTIWYGIVIHFFFNLTACLYELYIYN